MTAADRIRARVAELRATLTTEDEYIRHRVRERDHHGVWDSAIAQAEWEIEISALEWALKTLDETPCGHLAPYGGHCRRATGHEGECNGSRAVVSP